MGLNTQRYKKEKKKRRIWGGRPLKVNVTRRIEEQSGNKSAGNVKNKKTSSHSRGHGSPCVDVKVRYKVNSETGAFESQLLYCSFWDSSHPCLYTSYEAMTGNVHYWLLLSLCRAFFLVLFFFCSWSSSSRNRLQCSDLNHTSITKASKKFCSCPFVCCSWKAAVGVLREWLIYRSGRNSCGWCYYFTTLVSGCSLGSGLVSCCCVAVELKDHHWGFALIPGCSLLVSLFVLMQR